MFYFQTFLRHSNMMSDTTLGDNEQSTSPLVLKDDDKKEVHSRNFCHLSHSGSNKCEKYLGAPEIKLNSSDDETYVKVAEKNRPVYVCGCNKKFFTKKLLKKHQAMGEVKDEWPLDGSTDEEGNVVYTCECTELFETVVKLKEHRNKGKCIEYSRINENYEVKRDNRGRKVYFCRLCRQTFCGKNFLLQHRSASKCKSVGKVKGDYHCEECEYSFSKKKFLIIHRRKYHVQEFKCEHCSKDFTNITALRNHKKLVHNDGFTKFACEYCAMKFLGISALAKHIRKHTNERPYKCHVCKKSFVVERSLKAHLNFVHSTGGKNFICDICGITFARKEYLLNHAHVHNKDRRFRCEFCGASFRWNAAKRKHLFQKHQDKLTLFKCSYCDKKFKLEKNCESHELTHEKSFA